MKPEKKKVGRKNQYDIKVKPRFREIKEMVEKGLAEKQIAKAINVGYSTFLKYKSLYKEFQELLLKNRESCVENIENSMYKSSLGFKETLAKGMKVKRVIYDEKTGKKKEEYEEVIMYEEEIYIPPNVTAGMFLLKNWGKSKGYTFDPKTVELKEREIKLKEEEKENWVDPDSEDEEKEGEVNG